MLIESVENDIGVCVALELDDDSHSLTVGLIADTRNSLYSLISYQIGDLFDKSGFVDLIRDFGDYDLLFAVAGFFYLGYGSYNNLSLAGAVCLSHGRLCPLSWLR